MSIRLKVLLFLGAVIFAAPGVAAAQVCHESCVAIEDDNGMTIGWGCSVGTAGRDCEATISQCTLTTSPCGGGGYDDLIVDTEGAALMVAQRCSATGQLLYLRTVASTAVFQLHETPIVSLRRAFKAALQD